MAKLHNAATATSMLAELSHVFCCGLPMVAAVLSAGSQIGLSGFFLTVHSFTHDYEVAILIGSGLLLLAGLALQYISYQIDCRSNGCVHEPCTPKKFKVSRIFLIASILYASNVAFYLLSGHAAAPIVFS